MLTGNRWVLRALPYWQRSVPLRRLRQFYASCGAQRHTEICSNMDVYVLEVKLPNIATGLRLVHVSVNVATLTRSCPKERIVPVYVAVRCVSLADEGPGHI